MKAIASWLLAWHRTLTATTERQAAQLLAHLDPDCTCNHKENR